MDAWARMFQEEADTLAFLLQEEMEDIMKRFPQAAMDRVSSMHNTVVHKPRKAFNVLCVACFNEYWFMGNNVQELEKAMEDSGENWTISKYGYVCPTCSDEAMFPD